MTAKAEIKKYGQVAIDALFEDYSSYIHDLGVFLAQDPKELTSRAQKKAALRVINVIKEKGYGESKGEGLPTKGTKETCTRRSRRPSCQWYWTTLKCCCS